MLSESTDMSSPASTQSDLPNDLGASFYALITNSPPNLRLFKVHYLKYLKHGLVSNLMSSAAAIWALSCIQSGRGTIVSSRPGFHTVVVDSSNNTLEVPEDEYGKWYSLYERKSDADSSIDTRLANRARAKNMMDNWCKRRKRAKKSAGSCAGEVPVDDDGYAGVWFPYASLPRLTRHRFSQPRWHSWVYLMFHD